MSDDRNAPRPPRQTKADPVRQWNRAVEEAFTGTEDEARVKGARAVLEASDEEIARQLREAGVDLDAEEAEADAMFEEAYARFGPEAQRAQAAKQAQAEPASVQPPPADDSQAEPVWTADAGERANVVRLEPRRRSAVWVAYAIAAAAATGGAAYVAAHRNHDDPPPPDPPVIPPVSPSATAPEPPAPSAPAPAPAPAPDPRDQKGPPRGDKGPR